MRDYISYKEMDVKILVVDDEVKVREVLQGILSQLGYKCTIASSASEAILMLQNDYFPIVLTDIRMPEIDGFQLLTTIKANYPDIDVMCTTGYSKEYTFTDVIKAGASDFLTKPFSKDELEAKLNRIISERSLKSDILAINNKLKESNQYLNNIIESSLDAIVVSDNRGCITKANQSFLTLLGYEKEEVLGKSMAECSPLEIGIYATSTGETFKVDEVYLDRQKSKVYETLFGEGRIVNWELYLIRKDRTLIPCEENIVFLSNEKGETIGAVGIIRDITKRKQSERDIKKEKEL